MGFQSEIFFQFFFGGGKKIGGGGGGIGGRMGFVEVKKNEGGLVKFNV